MLEWLRNLGLRRRALEGAPAVRRIKTYTAESGYVYQYFYLGHRPGSRREPATEHVFQVSTSRRAYAPLSVFLTTAAVEGFEQAHARLLNPTERYAMVKLALFQAFDERAGPDALHKAVYIRPGDLDSFADTLGLL